MLPGCVFRYPHRAHEKYCVCSWRAYNAKRPQTGLFVYEESAQILLTAAQVSLLLSSLAVWAEKATVGFAHHVIRSAVYVALVQPHSLWVNCMFPDVVLEVGDPVSLKGADSHEFGAFPLESPPP